MDICKSKKNATEVGFALGRHMTVEFYDCDAHILADCGLVEQVFLAAACKSGATVIDSNFHEFKPQGVSGVVVISESHFAVHAWPEYDFAAVDLFTCGDKVDFDTAIEVIANGLKSGEWIISSQMNRGIVGTNGVERRVPVIEGGDACYELSWESKFEQSRAHAISAAIDVYNCDVPQFANFEWQFDFAQRFLASLSLTPVGAGRYDSGNPAVPAFEQQLKSGLLSWRLDLEHKTVYIDLFADRFFDPRKAAEFAISEFRGRYYRLQPFVRQ